MVDSGEIGKAAVVLTARSRTSNRFRIPGMYKFALDADVFTLEPEMAPCLLCSQGVLARTRGRECVQDVPFTISRRLIYAVSRELATPLTSWFFSVTSNLGWNDSLSQKA
jgi:hypothetical protein